MLLACALAGAIAGCDASAPGLNDLAGAEDMAGIDGPGGSDANPPTPDMTTAPDLAEPISMVDGGVCLVAATTSGNANACTNVNQCCAGLSCGHVGGGTYCCAPKSGDFCTVDASCCNNTGVAANVKCEGGKCCHKVNGVFVCQ